MSMSPGAFRANAPDLDVEAMQRDLARIPAVTSARVIVEDEELREVHIVCGSGRSPKLVGRDVQSLLAARWGVDIDHRKVSVVQLEGAEPGTPATDTEPQPQSPPDAPAPTTAPATAMITIESLTIALTGSGAEATVTVAAGGRQGTGRARGVPSWSGQRRLAATAALEALAELDPRLADFAVGDIAAVRMGGEDVVVTTLNGWANGIETNLAGAAPIGGAGELRAAAESVLRALPARA